KNVLEVVSSRAWIKDFFRAVNPVADRWVSSYRVAERHVIQQGTLTYRTLANDFHEEMDLIHHKGKSRVVKGAFGPTHADHHEQDDDFDASGDAHEHSVEVGTRSRRGAHAKKRLAVSDEESEQVCAACGLQQHLLNKCWYVSSETKPRWWRPNKE